jgi:retron-type reverse transcriptase
MGSFRNKTMMEQVLARGNLLAAWQRVKSNKGAPGIDGMTVEAFPAFSREHWPRIRCALMEGTYRPAPVRRVFIPKPEGTQRPLGVPTVLDRVIQQLIRRYLEAGVVLPDGTREATPQGVPQGGLLSPLLANIVLDPLDKELERRGHRFASYADDFLVMVKSAKAAERVMASLTRFIEGRLKLVYYCFQANR